MMNFADERPSRGHNAGVAAPTDSPQKRPPNVIEDSPQKRPPNVIEDSPHKRPATPEYEATPEPDGWEDMMKKQKKAAEDAVRNNFCI